MTRVTEYETYGLKRTITRLDESELRRLVERELGLDKYVPGRVVRMEFYFNDEPVAKDRLVAGAICEVVCDYMRPEDNKEIRE